MESVEGVLIEKCTFERNDALPIFEMRQETGILEYDEADVNRENPR